MELRLVIQPTDNETAEAHVELDFEVGWIACHELVHEKGVWVPSGVTTYHREPDWEQAEPTHRQRRKASLDRHILRVQRTLEAGIDLDTRSQGNWFYELVHGMKIGPLRSRRGRRRVIDPDYVDRARSKGKSLREIADELGVTHGAVRNAVIRDQKRDLT